MLSDFLVGAGSALGEVAPAVERGGQVLNERDITSAIAELQALRINPNPDAAAVQDAIKAFKNANRTGVSDKKIALGDSIVKDLGATRERGVARALKAKHRTEDVTARTAHDAAMLGESKKRTEIAGQRLSQAGDFTDAQLAAIRQKGIDQEWFTGISAEDYFNFVTGKGPLPEQLVDITAAIGAATLEQVLAMLKYPNLSDEQRNLLTQRKAELQGGVPPPRSNNKGRIEQLRGELRQIQTRVRGRFPQGTPAEVINAQVLKEASRIRQEINHLTLQAVGPLPSGAKIGFERGDSSEELPLQGFTPAVSSR